MARSRRGTVDASLQVSGLRELQRDVKKAADKDIDNELKEGLKKAAEPVLQDWRRQLEPIHAKSASKLRARVRAGSALVAQSARKTTGQHPEFATLQIKQGEDALERNAHRVEEILEDEMDDVADLIDKRGI